MSHVSHVSLQQVVVLPPYLPQGRAGGGAGGGAEGGAPPRRLASGLLGLGVGGLELDLVVGGVVLGLHVERVGGGGQLCALCNRITIIELFLFTESLETETEWLGQEYCALETSQKRLLLLS